jgi:hypothetical protein
MRLTRPNIRFPVVAALGAAIAATALVGPARAGDDRPLDEQILHSILMGIGLQDPNAAQPTYEERPPLVLPKNDTLPPPQKTGAAIAKNPAWPKDPDVQRAKALAKEERNRDTFAEFEREHNQLPPDQLGPKGPISQQARASSAPNGEFNYTGRSGRMSPSELGFHGSLFDTMFGDGKDQQQETARFTGEPARTSLTEPPPGYQTPSPNQPYGLGKQNTTPKATNDYLTRGEIKP